MIIKKMDEGVTSYWYESFDEIMSRPFACAANQRYQVNEIEQRASWVGATRAQVTAWLERGWAEGRPILEPMMAQLDKLEVAPAMATLRRRRKRLDDHGDTLHQQRVWNGQLDRAWDRMARVHIEGRTDKYVSVFIDGNTSGGIDWRNTLWRAAATLRLVDALQASGRHVRVAVGQVGNQLYAGQGYGEYSVHAVRVKDYQDPINIENLALMSTAMFYRTYTFRMMSASDPRKINTGYGHCPPDSMTKDMWPHPIKEDEIERGAMLIRIGKCFSYGDAEYIINQVRQRLASDVTVAA